MNEFEDVWENGDEHHTMEELYLYRMLWHAQAVNAWEDAQFDTHKSVKSFHHSDGELCFGGGWFIVVSELPTGQVSNHYRYTLENWNMFKIPFASRAPEYDGHTPAIAAERLLKDL